MEFKIFSHDIFEKHLVPIGHPERPDRIINLNKLIKNLLLFFNFLCDEVTCRCTDRIIEGHGNCQYYHRGRPTCYVQQPTNCPDAQTSTKDPAEKWSWDACDNGKALVKVQILTIELYNRIVFANIMSIHVP